MIFKRPPARSVAAGLLLGIGSACLLMAAPPAAHAQNTVQTFDGGGTTFTTTQFGSAPAAAVVAGGPSGSFLRLAVQTSASQANTVAFDRTLAGLPASVTAVFDFRMIPGSRADGLAFALLPTATTGIAGASPFFFSEDPNIAGAFGVGLDIFNNGGADPSNNHVSLHFNNAQIAVTDLNPATLDLAAGVFHRANIGITFGGGGATVNMTITPNSLGTPGAPVTIFSNQFINGFNPYESRVAFSARTGGANADHDIDNVNVQFTAGASAAAPEPGALSLLVVIGLPVAGRLVRKRRPVR